MGLGRAVAGRSERKDKCGDGSWRGLWGWGGTAGKGRRQQGARRGTWGCVAPEGGRGVSVGAWRRGGMGVLSELGIIAAAFPVCAILVLLNWDHMGAEGTRGSLEGQIPAPHLWAPWPASAVPLLTVRL